MKIAFISSLASSLLTFRRQLIIDLTHSGHEVLAFAPDYDEVSFKNVLDLGAKPVPFRMTRTGMNPISDLRALLQLISLLKIHRPDAVLSYFIKPVIYGSIAAGIASIPIRLAMMEGMGFVFTYEARPTARRSILRFFSKNLLRLALRSVDKLILLNHDDYNEFLEAGLVDPNKAVILGGIGVDLNKWVYETPKLKPIQFIFVGRLLIDKGVREFVSAASVLKLEYPNSVFKIIGARDDNPSAVPLEEIEHWTDSGIIEWPGHVPAQDELHNSSVFVLPSYREGVPCSTQEAMATGLPIITTDVPGCRETVIDGYNGLIVPPRNVDALTKAMQFFILNPDQIVPMGLKSREMAAQRFDVHVQNAKIISWLGAD